ncbi:MAG TPA: potassium-transporting ATPase subunit KdpC [Candidatus Binataceae bacterium]|jgi:K+-transporting ATPase ATPase C chain|nr:potassium-transporting ATPase subunit KdpC [Candidatus Binataceae bacterium]
MRTLIVAIRMTIVLTVLTGLAYPIVITGISLAVLPDQARGSLIVRNGKAIGSSLIGQNFSAPGYFHSRPSAAGDKGYDASSSSGSNLGPTNKVLIEAVKSRLKNVLEENPGTTAAQVPIDMVTASGSGLDPEISPAAAQVQEARVAKARGISEDQVRKLVDQSTRGRWMGILGEPGVNVLQLNLALDQAAPAGRQAKR